MINKVKDRINLYMGKTINFKYNGTRNKIEEFKGTIISTYPSIFIVKVNGNNSVKSFSYTDVLIHKLVIKD